MYTKSGGECIYPYGLGIYIQMQCLFVVGTNVLGVSNVFLLCV